MPSYMRKRILSLINECDAILVGIGSGMSSADGYNHYHRTDVMEKHFDEFFQRYNTDSLMRLFLYPYSTEEERFCFYSSYIKFMLDTDASESYIRLKKLIENKPHFVLTTNVDMQVEKTFSNYMTFNGTFKYFQCSQPCTDELFESDLIVDRLYKSIKDFKVDYDLLPRCPYCHRIMTPWVNDDNFLRGSRFNEEFKRYKDFVSKYVDKKLLLIMLGVGEMTPSIIKLPFWDLCYKRENVRLINVTLDKTTPPLHLKDRMDNYIIDINTLLKELCDD